MFNTLGNFLCCTTYGESHGEAIGGIIDGFPAGIEIDIEAIQKQLDRRKPGQSSIVTQRKEADKVRFLSGIFEGKSTGHPIAFQIQNTTQRSSDYNHNTDVFRPSHADFTYFKKYGIRDHRGGGRSSARETANWVVAGSLAKLLIPEIKINAFVSSVGTLKMQKHWTQLDFSEEDEVRCYDPEISQEMSDYIKQIKKQGDTVGGSIQCVANGVPVGWGEPIFHKLHAELGRAMLSINACKGFEIGSGFSGSQMKGSDHNDLFNEDGSTQSNFSGGVQGGISNGMPIEFKVAFKPVATLIQPQNTINDKGEKVEMMGKGRHDPCVVPRAVPIVEALTYFVLADAFLMNQYRKI